MGHTMLPSSNKCLETDHCASCVLGNRQRQQATTAKSFRYVVHTSNDTPHGWVFCVTLFLQSVRDLQDRMLPQQAPTLYPQVRV